MDARVAMPAAIGHEMYEGRFRSILERIPAARWGDADDVAGATVFLASPASDYVNGVVLPVDGGWLGR